MEDRPESFVDSSPAELNAADKSIPAAEKAADGRNAEILSAGSLLSEISPIPLSADEYPLPPPFSDANEVEETISNLVDRGESTVTEEISSIPVSADESPLLPPLSDANEVEETISNVADSGESTVTEAPSIPTDLVQKIVRQVEYYFSDENLPTDKFLLKFVKKNKEGYVPISVISSFRKMKKLVHDDDALIAAALQTSSLLVVSKEGKRVKRLHPLPEPPHEEDRRACTVVVENLPEDCSVESLQKTFAVSGLIRKVSIQDPSSTEEHPKISGKLHALVDFETPESAENAVASLNDQKNWSGLRVELLLKRMERFGLISKPRKPGPSTTDNPSPNDQIQASGQEVEAKRRKQRGKSGLRSQPAGPSPSPSNLPPVGPRMPDGTRGFSMGRGKPILSGP